MEKSLYKNLFLISLIAAFIFGCRSSKTEEQKVKENTDLQQLINKSHFIIEHQWMKPLRAQQISITNNDNYIKMYGDSISVFLPYYGIRQFGNSYGSTGGIEINGTYKNLSVNYDKEKEISISFEAKNQSEAYQFNLTIYHNKKVNTYVVSNQRDNISYQGYISKLDSIQ